MSWPAADDDCGDVKTIVNEAVFWFETLEKFHGVGTNLISSGPSENWETWSSGRRDFEGIRAHIASVGRDSWSIGGLSGSEINELCKGSQQASRSGVVHQLTHLDNPWVVVVYWEAKAKWSIVKENRVLIYKKECSTTVMMETKQELK